MEQNTIKRYAITAIKLDGLRQLARHNWGHNHFDERRAAEDFIKCLYEVNSKELIEETMGTDLQVRPVECYSSSGDAVRTIFPD